jgi:hypothetical protein
VVEEDGHDPQALDVGPEAPPRRAALERSSRAYAARHSARSPEGEPMKDKSPHNAHSAKKSGKSIKEKRAERDAKAHTTAQLEQLMHPKKAGR